MRSGFAREAVEGDWPSASGNAAPHTVKAIADGYYRYVFAGTTNGPAATATGDCLYVR